jgi:hypothetical protein
MWQTMEVLQVFVLVNLYVFLVMSLWACFKLNGKGQYKYLLTACFGQLLLIDEIGNILGPTKLWLSLIYLSFSIVMLAHSFVIPRIGQITLPLQIALPIKRKALHKIYSVAEQPNFQFNELIKEAQYLLEQEEIEV